MLGYYRSQIGAILLLVFWQCEAFAASIRPTLVSGLMQQPSSQYYNFVQGGQIDLSKNDDAGLLRMQYLERPVFENAGFEDQDFSAILLFGTSVFKWKDFGLTALLGGGQTWGYLKESKGEAPERNSYRLHNYEV